MKIILSIINLIILLVNIYFIFFLKGLTDYKINGTLSPTYSYFFLEKPIKDAYNAIEGQNIIIEKGSNLIVKEKIYQINKDTIISGKMYVTNGKRKFEKPFKNKTIDELYTNQKRLNKIEISSFGSDPINKLIVLTKEDIKNIITGDYKNTKTINLY